MARPTFRQFTDAVDSNQLDEIFGKFFQGRDDDRAKKAKEAFLKRKEDAEKRKEEQEKKREELKKRRDELSGSLAAKRGGRSAAASDRHGEREWVSQLAKESTEALSLDQIRAGLKPIMKRLAAVKSQEDYDKFLASFDDGSEIADTHLGGSGDLDTAADSLHYHQKTPAVSAFLKAHVVRKSRD